MEGSTVDLEGERSKVKDSVQVDVNVRTTWNGKAWSGRIGERVEVDLVENDWARVLGGGRVGGRSSDVAKDSGVDTASETWRTKVGKRANPVVSDGLVGIQDHGVTLTGKDAKLINDQRLSVDTVCLDDCLYRRVNGLKPREARALNLPTDGYR